MFCKSCGASLSDKAKFCTVCGTPVTVQATEQAPAQNAAAPAAPVEAAPVPEAPAAPVEAAPVPEAPAAPVEAAPVQEAAASPDVPESVPVAEAPVSMVNEQPSAPQTSQPVQPESIQFSAEAQQNDSFGILPPDQNIFSGEEPTTVYGAKPVSEPVPGGYDPAFQQGGQMPAPDAQFVQNAVPIQPDYSSGAAAVVKTKKQVKKLNLPVTIIISILFGILAFALITAGFTAGSVRQGVASHSISDAVKKVDLGDLTVGDLLSSPMLKKTVESNGLVLPDKKASKATVAEVASLTLISGRNNISEKQVSDILSKLNISGELATVVEAYEDYLLTGKAGDQFEDGLCEEIKRIVRDGEKDVTKITNMRLTDNYEETLDKALDDNEDMIEGILPENSLRKFSSAIGVVFSPIVLISALVLAVILVALTGLISKRAGAALMTGGVVFTITGVILFAASIILSDLTIIPALGFNIVKDFVTPALNGAFGSKFMMSGIICAGVGVSLIIAFILVKVIGKALSKKAAQQ